MKPIVININSLVGKIIVAGESENVSGQIKENVTNTLLEFLKKSLDGPSESTIKDYSKAKSLLQDLIETASRAINAIEDNRPNWEISNIAVDEIDELTKQISTAVLGDSSSFIKRDSDIVK